MQIMQYCALPFKFSGLPDFVLQCDEEEGGVLEFNASLMVSGKWAEVRSKVQIPSGEIRFRINDMDGDAAREIFLDSKTDKNTKIVPSEFKNKLTILNETPHPIGTSPNGYNHSLAKIFCSQWVKQVESQADRTFARSMHRERRQVQREHFVLFSKQCYVEFIATDPWKIILGT